MIFDALGKKIKKLDIKPFFHPKIHLLVPCHTLHVFGNEIIFKEGGIIFRVYKHPWLSGGSTIEVDNSQRDLRRFEFKSFCKRQKIFALPIVQCTS